MGKMRLKKAEQKWPPLYSSAISCSDKCLQPLSPSSPLQPQHICGTCVNIILWSCSRTGASDMRSVAISPMLCSGSMMSRLPPLGIDAYEMSIGNKSSQNYPARNAGNPTELCVTVQTHHYLMLQLLEYC